MTLFPVAIRFTVGSRVKRRPLHDALERLRSVEVEAPTEELAEHYADEIRRALERQAE